MYEIDPGSSSPPASAVEMARLICTAPAPPPPGGSACSSWRMSSVDPRAAQPQAHARRWRHATTSQTSCSAPPTVTEIACARAVSYGSAPWKNHSAADHRDVEQDRRGGVDPEAVERIEDPAEQRRQARSASDRGWCSATARPRRRTASASGSLNPPDSPQVSGHAAIEHDDGQHQRGSATAPPARARRRRARRSARRFSPTLRLNIGMNAAENAPSANSARNMLGRRNATKNASDAKPAPT